MTPQRRAKLLALDDLHRQWVAPRIESTPFDPDDRPGSRDYNQHFVDLDGDDDEFHRQAMAIVKN